MDIQEVIITPQLASEFLKKNHANRPLKKYHLEFLCEEMKRGRWKFNGDTIRFSPNGNLIDGQHRLEAVKRTGVSIKTLIAAGIDQDVFDTIDMGSIRSPSDTLSTIGEKNACVLAASVVLADSILEGKTSFVRKKVSNAELLDMLNRHAKIRESIPFGRLLKGLVPISLAVSLHYIFSTNSPEKADGFFKTVAAGEYLNINSPAYLLRQRLIKNATSKSKLSRRYIAALFIKAWNAWIVGLQLKKLRWCEEGDSPEQFPTINRIVGLQLKQLRWCEEGDSPEQFPTINRIW